MQIHHSDIIALAVKPNQYPADDLPEIAFAGRSNVGKSSLLNFLTGRKALARTSSAPGKTRTINFYLIDDSFRFVDLPGYGYARISRSESEKWGQMMERYLTGRRNLKTVLQLVDSRHKPSAQDIQMYDFLQYYGLAGPVIATKADKLKRSELARNLRTIRQELEMDPDVPVIPVSALKKTGRAEVLAAIESYLTEPAEEESDQ